LQLKFEIKFALQFGFFTPSSNNSQCRKLFSQKTKRNVVARVQFWALQLFFCLLAITNELLTLRVLWWWPKEWDLRSNSGFFFFIIKLLSAPKVAGRWKELISSSAISDPNYNSCILFFQCKVIFYAESSSSIYCLVPSLKKSSLLGTSSSSIFFEVLEPKLVIGIFKSTVLLSCWK
jgi:hypothetical protein